ncbi:baseplate assembly protein [Sphingomonas aracearum]|uniref:Baseplate assembly protein n=1 Tax=Sphingomonas aracearum TaxID=2283317 RepID=A0A369VT16_9SPHN|nr:baseplate J/gp47 family protein [Sphingomonas aracearum]RDE04687.1 baseplate assembly protein [Sphingomonas aracearum]
MLAPTLSTVDLSRLPAPTIVEQLDYETILAQMIAELQVRLPGFDATVDSDPAVKVLQAAAYRELLLRQTFNERARQVMTAYATGANLDQLAALVGVSRLDAEADDPFRKRIVLAPNAFSVAGPRLAYVFHAKSAHPDVLDASAISPAPGEVLVSVLSAIGNGAASPELTAAVAAIVTADTIRPLGDLVTVASAQVVPFAIEAQIYTYSGPDAALLLAASRTSLDAYLADSRKLGRDVTLSGLYAALTVPGVQRVVLAQPSADIVCDPRQAAWCSSIALTHGGYDG